jgi:dTDP-glucose 4,6-dehydratase
MVEVSTVRLLVTGGAGFIGSNFVRRMLAGRDPEIDVDSVIVLDALTYSGTLTNLREVEHDPRFTFVHGDIRDAETVRQAIQHCDVVVHFAAESHVDRSVSDSRVFVETNVLGTHTVLDAALRAGVRRVVHVSTDEVYGSIEAGSWTEASILEPNSPYAASKASSDLLARSYHRTHNLDIVITRCSNNYGPHQFPEKVIPLFVTNLLDGRPVPLYGDGLNVRDWLHVDDHCRGIALVLASGRAGEIYNIGGGHELTNLELTRVILELTHATVASLIHVTDRKGHDRRYSIGDAKIRAELGYRPSVPFRQGVESTVQWYRDNRAWWEPLVNTAAR